MEKFKVPYQLRYGESQEWGLWMIRPLMVKLCVLLMPYPANIRGTAHWRKDK
jgi:hypothetical protein